MSGSPGWAAVAGAAADKTLPKTPIPKPQRHLELQFRRWMRLLTLTSYPCQPLSPENPAPLRNPKYTRETGRATPIHQLGIERLSFEDIFMGNWLTSETSYLIPDVPECVSRDQLLAFAKFLKKYFNNLIIFHQMASKYILLDRHRYKLSNGTCQWLRSLNDLSH